MGLFSDTKHTHPGVFILEWLPRGYITDGLLKLVTVDDMAHQLQRSSAVFTDKFLTTPPPFSLLNCSASTWQVFDAPTLDSTLVTSWLQVHIFSFQWLITIKLTFLPPILLCLYLALNDYNRKLPEVHIFTFLQLITIQPTFLPPQLLSLHLALNTLRLLTTTGNCQRCIFSPSHS